jgi:hypothetical protein
MELDEIYAIIYIMFSSKNIYYVLFVFSMIIISAYASKKWKAMFTTNDEYDMIKNYLLTDSPLYGFNKPKIWIHSKFEYNSRKWQSFHSRSSRDLNQPYIHLTIRSIIDHCGDDFHICLIDDDTFSKLIPSWDLDLATVAEPMKSQLREIGMAELVYYYGGIVLPNSFLCTKNIIELYHQGIEGDKMFVCENVNHSENLLKQKVRKLFIPSTYIFGAPKNNAQVKEYVKYLKQRNQTPHFSNMAEFMGDTSTWCIAKASAQEINVLGGEFFGVKTTKGKPVLLDHLMEEEYIPFSVQMVGIYIPGDEILTRTKHKWFAVMPSEQLVNTNMLITKYMKSSMVDVVNKTYQIKHEVNHHNVSAI